MSINVSFINMKGGVGKTTLAMQAALSAQAAGLRVLAVDLDPQSNLSQALLNREVYVEMVKQNRGTVVQLFEGYSPAAPDKPSPSAPCIDEVIMKSKSGGRPDLIPSRLELCQTLRNPGGKDRRLAEALAAVSTRYNIVMIDCAPADSMLTDAAYFASRYVIVPVKPEFLAAIGVPLLARSLKAFKERFGDHTIEIAGIVFVHLEGHSPGPESKTSMAEVTRVAKDEGWRIFSHDIPFSRVYAKAAREGQPLEWTSRAHQSPKAIKAFNGFMNELFGALGIEKKLPEAGMKEYV